MTNYNTIAESNNFIVLEKYSKKPKVSESYQSEYDLEGELIQDLVNQGYEYLPSVTNGADHSALRCSLPLPCSTTLVFHHHVAVEP